MHVCFNSHDATQLHFTPICIGASSFATPLKDFSSSSFVVGEHLALSPDKGTCALDCLELPPNFPAWKLHVEDSVVHIYRLITKGIPKGYSPVSITHVLSFADAKWDIWVHGRSLSSLPAAVSSSASPSFPVVCTTASVKELLDRIEELPICQGAGIPPLYAAKELHAYVDSVPTPVKDQCLQMQTLRDEDCTLLVPAKALRCHSCTKLKEKLRQKTFCKSGKEDSGSRSFTANVHLSTPEKLRKLAALAVDVHDSRRKIASLSARLKACHQESISVDPELDQDLADIMANSKQALPDGSFRKLFWEQQMEALKSKDPRQRRWHPLIIKWCLNLKMMSSAAYDNLRTSGMLVLPSQRTLRDYANVVKAAESFCTEVIHQLFNEARQGQDDIPYHRW